MLFADLIQEAVEVHGVEALAKLFGATPGTISRWASGNSVPASVAQDMMFDILDEGSFAARVERSLETLDARDIARRLEVATSTVSRWARGASCPGIYSRSHFCKELEEMKRSNAGVT